MATHSSILAWEIPWTERPGGLHSRGLQQVESCCQFQGVEVETLGQELGGPVAGQAARVRNRANQEN